MWKPIETFRGPDREAVDLWLVVYGAYRVDGKWFHHHEGKEMEVDDAYITHWAPIPKPPKARRNRR